MATATELSKGSCSQRKLLGCGVMTRSVSNQPQVVTLARPEHHAMFAEADGLTVTVDGGVVHREKDIRRLFRESLRRESHRSRP